MNNTLNAKLSKLIYALASDNPNYLAKAGVFDRLLPGTEGKPRAGRDHCVKPSPEKEPLHRNN